MIRKMMIGLAALVAGAAFGAPSQAQDIKLYAFSSGALTIGKGYLQNGAPMTDRSRCRWASSWSCIRRAMCCSTPATTTRSSPIRPTGAQRFKALKPVNTPDVAIDTQLQKIGLKPDDIKYVVVEPPASRSWRQRREVPETRPSWCRRPRSQNAFWPEIGTGANYIIGDVMPLRVAQHRPAERGQDGPARTAIWICSATAALVVKRWVGHTPGSQMMTVRLKNKGLTILTGDNVYFRENVEKNVPPSIVPRLFAERHSQRLRVDSLRDGNREGGLLHRA